MGFLDRFGKKSTVGHQSPISNDGSRYRLPIIEMAADQLIDELEKLGYFSYADPADQHQLKGELGKGLAERHYFPYIETGRPRYQGIDPRQYILNNEDLFEKGGILRALKEMAPLFAKMNISMEISDHVEEYDQIGLNCQITLNGKPYIIFHQWKGYGWGESAQRFADIVNDQLAIQNSSERLYLIQGAEDGRAVFLTTELHILVRPLIDDLRECPLPTQEWCKVWGVAWVNVTDWEFGPSLTTNKKAADSQRLR